MRPFISVVLRGLLVMLIAGGVCAGAVPARAQQAAGVTLAVRAGFDGYYKDGQVLPVRVTVANDGPDVKGVLQIAVPRGFGSGETVVTRRVELPTQSRREIFFYVGTEGYQTSIKVELLDGQKILASATARMAQLGQADLLYGVLAGSPSAFNNLVDVDPVNGSAMVAQLEAADLPPLAVGWGALDVLVISDVDTGALSPEQRTALADWVARGRRLIVAGGPAWQKTSAGLGPLLPLTPSGARTLAELQSFGEFASAAAPSGNVVAAEGSPTADAEILISAPDGLPLVLSRPLGFGRVIFLAVDPAFAPLKGWDGLEGLFRRILSAPLDQPVWADGIRDWSSMNTAVNAVPGLDLPAAWQICGFLGIYLIVIGPLNYLILRKLKRRELAWLTIPFIVCACSLTAYLTGFQLRGTQVLLHRLAIVQVWPGVERARVDQTVGLFSPQRTTYDVEFAPGQLGWPLPGSDGAVSGQIEQGDSTRVTGVRAEIASVSPFVTQGYVPAPRFAAQLTLKVNASGNLELNGTVSNLSDLALTDAVVLGPGMVLRLGDLPAGEARAVSMSSVNAQAFPLWTGNPAPVLPFNPAPNAPLVAPAYNSGNPDSTFGDILGYTYPSNREEQRRSSILASIVNQYNSGGRGGGVYLVGWTSVSPLDLPLPPSPRTLDLSLYFVALPVTLDMGSGTVTVPPALMTWESIASNSSSNRYYPGGPYAFYLDTGYQAAFKFVPLAPVTFSRVSGLALRLENYNTNSALPTVELWDFTENVWVQQAGVTWGTNVITAPARFVGSRGEVMVRLVNTSNLTSQNIEAVDVTLTVEK